jgi:hypothetical protein
MKEPTAAQAQPVEGRIFPTKARGARPTFFDDAGATDAVIDIITALSAEVWALHERIDSLEAVLEASDTLDRSSVESHRSDPIESEARAADAAAFTGRIFRVFAEMREEVVAGETEDGYLSLVQRAFDEI